MWDIRKHLGIKDFEYGICSQKFVDEMHLQRHFTTHVRCQSSVHLFKMTFVARVIKIINFPFSFQTGEKPYQCSDPSCKKRFSSFTNMKEHSFIHTDKRPSYFRECTICGKVFRRAGLLAEHYQKNHDSMASESIQIKLDC